MKRRGLLRMFERAVNQDWPFPESERTKAIKLADEVLADPHATNRERLAASRVLVAMGREKHVATVADDDGQERRR